ncbi:uncharacterized protein LOC114866178 [Betta splendens]|uniref:Uncharacterized protein LOC114866178 n=1 Tax=Betta splendens TaxID=158456 RepID=A0A8M1HMT1_BETSP|nr:uncharacterized protein LOC114866178 [Betta splendens]
MTDMRRLCSSTENQDEAWIGLHSYPGRENRKWYWSLPGLEFNNSTARWASGEPNDGGPNFPIENCGVMIKRQWHDYPCNGLHTFICSNETKQSNTTFHYIDTPMTWPQAQNHCRQHYTDLVSGLDQLDDPTVVSQSYVWIGLFRDTWRWSDGSNSSLRNWQSLGDLVDGQSNKTCATVLNTAGTWSYDYCDTQKPFYCYEANPKRKYVVRVKLAADPSVNMTDPAVTESMLKQMEARLKEKGLSVKLSWRKLPIKLNIEAQESKQGCT